MMNTSIYLYVNALMYFVFSAWCAIAPEWTASAVGFALPGAQGFAEYVAVYGGLQFGVAAFFLLAARRAELGYAGVLFGLWFYIGLFCFRSLAVYQVGLDIGAGRNFYLAEFVLMIWSIITYRAQRNGSMGS